MIAASQNSLFSVELRTVEPQTDNKDFPKVTEAQYLGLLDALVSQGQAASKKSSIIAIPLLPLQIVTLNNAGNSETKQEMPLDNFLVFDRLLYTDKSAVEGVQNLFKDYGYCVTNLTAEQTIQICKGSLKPVVAGIAEGVWVMVKKNLNSDYQLVEGSENTFQVKEGTGRLCLPVDGNFNIPTQWGDFNVRNGGHAAIRLSDVPALTEALQKIRSGKSTIKDELYTADGKAKFDVYGMDPGFFDNNYAFIPQPREVSAAIATYKQGHVPGPKAGPGLTE